jgi:hypothetical protein
VRILKSGTVVRRSKSRETGTDDDAVFTNCNRLTRKRERVTLTEIDAESMSILGVTRR